MTADHDGHARYFAERPRPDTPLRFLSGPHLALIPYRLAEGEGDTLLEIHELTRRGVCARVAS